MFAFGIAIAIADAGERGRGNCTSGRRRPDADAIQACSESGGAIHIAGAIRVDVSLVNTRAVSERVTLSDARSGGARAIAMTGSQVGRGHGLYPARGGRKGNDRDKALCKGCDVDDSHDEFQSYV